MSRYIKFDDAVKVMACEMYAEAQSQGYEVDSIEDFMPEAKAWMNDAPSADRPQGEWIRTFDGNEWYWYCSNCKEQWYEEDLWMGGNEFPHFCPNCGARMKGADDDSKRD